jgi:glycerophosphoryl diester phosphodiesterase
MLPIVVPPGFHIIAHRGASAYAPENTRAAFDLAARMGVTEVELDTQLTADGEIALCHDATLARYLHGDRRAESRVESLTWAELSALDMGAWFSPFLFGGERMLTLDELFAAYGHRFVYHVEIKGQAPALPGAVRDAIARHRLGDRVVVTSFSYASLVAMRTLDADLRLGWLAHTFDDDALAKARAIDLYQLCPAAATVDAAQVTAARTVVPEVRAWGIQGEQVATQVAEVASLIRRVLDAGCNGMTINWPDWVQPAA